VDYLTLVFLIDYSNWHILFLMIFPILQESPKSIQQNPFKFFKGKN